LRGGGKWRDQRQCSCEQHPLAELREGAPNITDRSQKEIFASRVLMDVHTSTQWVFHVSL
jgi:hypothetical protein